MPRRAFRKAKEILDVSIRKLKFDPTVFAFFAFLAVTLAGQAAEADASMVLTSGFGVGGANQGRSAEKFLLLFVNLINAKVLKTESLKSTSWKKLRKQSVQCFAYGRI